MRRVVSAPVGRRSAWLSVVLGLLVAVGLTVLAPAPDRGTGVSAGLPSSAESVQVAELAQQLPGADATSALVVLRRDGGCRPRTPRRCCRCRSRSPPSPRAVRWHRR